MPKVLFVALHRPDRSPSQRFRYEQYLGELKAAGWDFELSYVIKEQWDKPFYSKGNYLTKLQVLLYSFWKRWMDVRKASDFDVVFVQREAIMIGTAFFERQFKKKGCKLIFDFDDAIWLPNVSKGNVKLSWLKSPAKTAKIISIADLVIAGNDYLAEYARKFNSEVEVFPTTIDISHHTPISKDSDDNRIRIGWTGSSTTLKHFEIALPVLRRIKKKYPGKLLFKVVGDANYKNEELGITGIPWDIEREISDLQDIDIGIMPLLDDQWSRGKCGLKCLQYMALNIPAVISPVGVNVQIVSDGQNGFLASTENEWVEKISRLIEDTELRRNVGQAARRTIEENYAVSSRSAEYLNYFNRLLKQ